ncbi:MAG: endoglucanase A [Myxococcales bacterium]|nr:endoglucanase A [Myxococcales bacterium]
MGTKHDSSPRSRLETNASRQRLARGAAYLPQLLSLGLALGVAIACGEDGDAGGSAGASGGTAGGSNGGNAGSTSGGNAGSANGGSTGASGGASGSGFGGSGGTGIPADASFLPPDDPGGGSVRFDISSEARHGISPGVYCTNQPDWQGHPHVPMARQGGNRMTAYNWENNASNAGSDYQHQNDSFLGGGDTPGEVVRLAVQAAHDHDAAMLVTVPLVGYVAADKNGGGDVNQTPNYLQTRFKVSQAFKGSSLSEAPDPSDGYVYQDEFVNWLDKKFPYAKTDARRAIFFSMDNEPDLWAHTHERIHPDPVGFDELLGRNVEYAKAVKSVLPQARVFGSVNYGWAGMTNLQDAPDNAGRDYLDFFLDGAKAAEQEAGRRLIDVLDFHWYPEAQGGGERITASSTGAAVVAARLQAPRSLWDADYSEDSWITQYSTNGPINLLRRIQDKIATHYPGTELAITEYNYGGTDHISGGIAQADVLGIYGRENVFAACYWSLTGQDSYVWAAFDAFLSYDGAGAGFGDTGLDATTSDVPGTSIYASLDDGEEGRMVLVALNKTGAPIDVGFAVTHTQAFSKAEVYEITSSGATPVRGADISITKTNAFVHQLPAMSISTLVLLP